MSRDLIAFDPAGLDGMTGDRSEIMASISAYLADNEPEGLPDAERTARINAFLQQVDGSYLAAYVGSNGRYCNVNQPDQGGWENTIMSYCEAAQSAQVILIDPQGNEPIMSTPDGAGLLDF